MGGGRWDSDQWDTYAKSSYGSSDRATLRSSNATSFTATALDDSLDPSKTTLGFRESRDSDDNPLSTPILLFTDVTGSMGYLAKEVLVSQDVVCTELYDRKPVTDPHIATGAVGDAFSDRAPLQVTEFEADIRIVDQTRKLYVEGNGGGNGGESYAMAWLFAARLTSCDAWEKRQQKGFLFTVGDEPVHGAQGILGSDRGLPGVAVTRDQAKQFLGLDIEKDLSAEEIYDEAAQRWEIVHICLSKSGYRENVQKSFQPILGDRLLWLEDPKALPELIVSTIQVLVGQDKANVVASWDADANKAIASALKDLVPVAATGADAGGVARL